MLKQLNYQRIAISTASLLLLGFLIYSLFAHQLITLMYEGKAITPLNHLIRSQKGNSLGFYIKKADTFFFSFDIIALYFTLGIYFAIKHWSLLKQSIQEHQKILLLSFSLLLVFSGLYWFVGIELIPYHQKISFFGSDHEEHIWGLTNIGGNQFHKGSHPLLLLGLVPFGVLLSFLTGAKVLGIVLLVALTGGLTVGLASLCLWNLIGNYQITFLYSCIFGLSFSQLVFSSLPESYTFSACGIVATYLLFTTCLKQQKLYFSYWIAVGILSFGITITNFAQTLICFSVIIWVLNSNLNPETQLNSKLTRSCKTIAIYTGTVVVVALVLSLLQKQIFVDAKYFFLPGMVGTESKSLETLIFTSPLLVIKEIVKHFLLVNFIAADPFAGSDYEFSSRVLLGFFIRPLNYSFSGLLALSLWLSLYSLGLIKNILVGRKTIFLGAIATAVLFNASLHSVFGTHEMFLYTCDFTFPVLLMGVNRSVLHRNFFQAGLALLVLLTAYNNLTIIQQIVSGTYQIPTLTHIFSM